MNRLNLDKCSSMSFTANINNAYAKKYIGDCTVAYNVNFKN